MKQLLIGNATVSCYADVASLLVIILLLCLSERIYQRRSRSTRIFFLLCVTIGFTCIVCFVFNAMEGHTSDLSHTVALISRTLWELCVIATVCLWLAYVDLKLYGDRRKRATLQMTRVGIFTVFSVLLIINLFNGMLFTLGDDNTLQQKPLSLILFVAESLLFLSAAVYVWLFDRKTQKVRFLRVTPMIVPMPVFLLPQFFTPYNLGIIGFALGITLLYFSMADELRVLDEESGLYNQAFLAHLFSLAVAKKIDVRSVLILEAGGNLPVAFEILQSRLHQQHDVIRAEERKFLIFTDSDSPAALQYLLTLVDEAAAAHNANHPQEKVHISARSKMRDPKEDAFEFLRTAMNNEEVGDEMRGIVSMMSELNQLDKELSMAAEIQKNALPTNFPPFPERKEFSLYASMDPAKEVGGDFYDFFLIDEDHLALVIADVSGKGIPAALFMMVSKSLIKNNLISGGDPAKALTQANLQLCEHNDSMMFVTVWLAVLELSTGKGVACNAGHENPALHRAGEPFEILKYKHNMFVGGSEFAKYTLREFELKPGDSLLVYTDGVPEATNSALEMFGQERLLDALNRRAEADPEELIHYIDKTVNYFVGDAPQFDDLTMLSLKYYGPEGPAQ